MARTHPVDIAQEQRLTARSLLHHLASCVSKARVLDTVIVVTLLLLACWQYFPLVDDRPFHRDEARWIHRASYVRELAHPLSNYWDEATWIEQGGTLDERYRLRAQPPLGSYLMGLGLVAQGRDLDVNGFWNMDHDDAWNAARGNMPEPGDVTAARRTTAVVTALTVVVAYVIGKRLTNRVGGVAGALFLLVHPLVMLYASFAGSDMLLVLLVALAAMAAYRLADRPSWLRAIVLGVTLGLGGAAKLSPLGVAGGLALLGAVVLTMHYAGSRKADRRPGGGGPGLMERALHRFRTFLPGQATPRLGMQLVSVPLVAIATLVASYPYLWRAPLDHTRALFTYRETGMELQAAIWSHVAVETRLEALRRVERRLGDEFTVLERFGIAIGEVELAVAVVGMVLLGVMVMRNGLLSGPGMVLAVLGGQAAVTVIGMRVDWARYHLPILLFLAVCVGVAVGQGWTLFQWTIHWVSERREATRASRTDRLVPSR